MNKIRKAFYSLYSKYLINKYAYKRAKYEDRDILERIIFPNVLAYFNPKTILDIGREDYQLFYNKFFIGRKLWTIDIDPKRKKFGAKNHIVDNVKNLNKHFHNNYFDFILMNGVFGWGLDDKKDVQKTFLAIYDILKPNGIFILGWNDDIVPLKEIQGLKKLKPFHFAPLNGTHAKSKDKKHFYNFYTKQVPSREGI